MEDLKPGTKLVCKKSYFYNLNIHVNDVVEVIGYNEFNVRIKTPYNTYQNISYHRQLSSKGYELSFWELYYTKAETRQMKLSEIGVD